MSPLRPPTPARDAVLLAVFLLVLVAAVWLSR